MDFCRFHYLFEVLKRNGDIDKSGNFFIQPQYEQNFLSGPYRFGFYKGVVLILFDDNTFRYINTSGEILLQSEISIDDVINNLLRTEFWYD